MFTINTNKESTIAFSDIPERDFFYGKNGNLYLKMYGGNPHYDAINLSLPENGTIEWCDYWEAFEEEDMVFPAVVTIEARRI